MPRWCAGDRRAYSEEALQTAMGVFRPDLYDAALGRGAQAAGASDAIGAFAGPPFNPDDIAGHLAAFSIRRRKALNKDRFQAGRR